MVENLHFLVYVSSAVTPFSTPDLVALLEKAHAVNTALGVTGMLLYKDGNVMQVLEGNREVVHSLYAKIHRDPRHRGLLTLLEGPLTERQFPEWSMGFRNLTAADGAAIPGYSEFLNTPLTAAEFSSDLTRCQKLLTTFKKSM
jgi:hypothetical protein